MERSLLPGPSVAANAGSLDVSFQRLAAYGAASAVCVVDVEAGLSLVQTLDGHPGNVCVCRWASRVMDSNLDFEYKLTLASGDDKGNVLLWSVLEGVAELHLTDAPVGPVMDLSWHPTNNNLLLTLRAGNIVTLWDVSKGTCVWRRVFKSMDDMFCVAFNAFPPNAPLRDVFFGTRKGWVYHLPDVALSDAELSVKYKIAPPDAKATFNGMLMYEAVSGCVLFVLSRELLVFDMTTQHPVGGFSLDRGMANLVSVSTNVFQPGLIWALHEDGRLSVWRSHPPSFLSFSMVSASSPFRFSKTRRQDSQPLVGLLTLSRHSTYGSACLSMDRLGSLSVWSLDNNAVQLAELQQGFLSNVTTFALHPGLGAHQVACGTALGTLLIVDVVKRAILREFVIEAGQAVRKVRWFSSDAVMLHMVQEVQADAVWVNSVLKVSLATGRISPLLQTKRAEPTFIRSVKLSPSRRLMLVLRKDRPLELWDVSGDVGAHLGNVKPYIQVNAVTWREGGDGGGGGGEEFAAATSDNVLRTFRVENGRLSVVRQQEGLTIAPVTCIAWFGDTLATGDASGGLSLFDWRRKLCWTVNTRGASIVELRWNPSNSTVFILFVNGAVCVFDMAMKRQIAESTLLSARLIKIVEAEWATAECAVLACSDGCLRIVDGSLGSCNSFVPPLQVGSIMTTPYLLDARVALALKVSLLEGGRLMSGTDNGGTGAADAMMCVPPRVLNDVLSGSIAHRGLAVARFFGDAWEESLWLFVLGLVPRQETEKPQSAPIAAAPPDQRRQSVHEFLGQEVVGNGFDRNNAHEQGYLPSSFGLLRPDIDVREQFVAQTKALDHRRGPNDANTFHTTASRYILNGDKHNAIAVLSGSDPQWPSFEKDSLMACVVAAASGPEYFERTAKMAATGLIARGDVDLGVQLLVLVGKADEACRYLQDAGKWEDAVRLARLQLAPQARDEVLRKWAEHLSVIQETKQAVLVFLSLGKVARAVTLLHAQDRFQLALGLLAHFGDSSLDPQLLQGMHLDYGFFLHRLGLQSAQEEFAQAGPAGQQMMEALGQAPFEMRGRNRSGSGIIMGTASKRGLLGSIKDSLRDELKELRKKN